MSFVKTLATLAVGFAAAKGLDKYRQMGGMQGIEKMMHATGASGGGLGGMFGQMAAGLGGGGIGRAGASGTNALESMMAQFTGAGGAAQAGLGGLMAALTGGAAATAGAAADATSAGAGAMDNVFGALTGTKPVTDAAEANARLMIRAMIQAAKCDGEIDADEQAKIMDHLKDATPEEVAYVKEQLAAPLDIAGLAAEADAATKAQVYAAALMAIRVDSDAETSYLRQLAAALGLSSAQCAQMHAAMGVNAPAP